MPTYTLVMRDEIREDEEVEIDVDTVEGAKQLIDGALAEWVKGSPVESPVTVWWELLDDQSNEVVIGRSDVHKTTNESDTILNEMANRLGCPVEKLEAAIGRFYADLNDQIRTRARDDAASFVEEFGEPIDPAETDWDATGFGDLRRELQLDDYLSEDGIEKCYRSYVETLVAETRRLTHERGAK